MANRVANIHTLSDRKAWRHVPGQCNPADISSRGIPAEDLVENSLWWYGPDWLTQSPEHWPSCLLDSTV